MFFQDQHSFEHSLVSYFRDKLNWFDLVMYSLYVVSIALRLSSEDRQWMRAFYSLALVMSYLRLLQFFYKWKSLGPKVIMINKMVSELVLGF